MYSVSNIGFAKNNFTGRILQGHYTWNGYYRVPLQLTDERRSRYYLTHRIVMIEFEYISNYKSMQVNHKDGDKYYNCICNLEWCTGSENILHAFRNGLKEVAKGEDATQSTITNEQSEIIGQMLASCKYTHKEIADFIGCTISVVKDISMGSNWKNIYEKYNLESRKKKFVIRFTDEELHMVCKYFEDHSKEYIIRSDLFRALMRDLFNREFTNNMSATLNRLYNKQTRRDITCLYNY